MAKHEVTTTDAEIDAALRRAKSYDLEPVAQKVEHVRDFNLLVVILSNGRRLALPVEDLQGLSAATPEQIRNYELLGRGTGINFPDLDAALYVSALIKGVYGSQRWMAELGRLGGQATTSTKREASRANGAKGGRPRKVA